MHPTLAAVVGVIIKTSKILLTWPFSYLGLVNNNKLFVGSCEWLQLRSTKFHSQPLQPLGASDSHNWEPDHSYGASGCCFLDSWWHFWKSAGWQESLHHQLLWFWVSFVRCCLAHGPVCLSQRGTATYPLSSGKGRPQYRKTNGINWHRRVIAALDSSSDSCRNKLKTLLWQKINQCPLNQSEKSSY